jgi:hypothetical protein
MSATATRLWLKELYDVGGEAVQQEIGRCKPMLACLVPPEVKAAARALAVEQPAVGPIGGADELAKRGHQVSPSGVRVADVRNDSGTMRLCLRVLLAMVTQDVAVTLTA